MKTTTTIPDLSMDLTGEILSRVPLKHMRAVRSTCAKWNTLFTSESFMKMQQSLKAKGRRDDSRMIVLMNSKLHSVNIIDFDHYPSSTSTKLEATTTCLNKQVKISKVVNCEGILLCELKEDTRLMVWNPYLGQTTWIQHRHSHRRSGYALGYQDKDKKSLKLLSFMDSVSDNPQFSFSWYEVYDFDSGLWTTLDLTPTWCLAFSDALSVKGNSYWLAAERRDFHEEDIDFDIIYYRLICFDFTKERFGPFLSLPPSTRFDDYVSLSCVGHDKLAVLLQHNRKSDPYEAEIWITTKLDVQTVTWNIFLTMDTINHPKEIPFMTGGFFIHEDKKVAVGFNTGHQKSFTIIGEAGYSIQLHVGKPPDIQPPLPTSTIMPRPLGFSYVPSFLQINNKEPVQAHHMSLDEKHRFDQKMSRLAFLRKRQSDLSLESIMAKKKTMALAAARLFTR